MKLICITGLDGAGKTTLARNLVTALQAAGVPAVYRYGRGRLLLSRFIIWFGRMVFLERYSPWNDYGAYEYAKGKKMQSKTLRWIYTTIVLVDYFLQSWALFFFEFWRKRWVILDRYIFDFVINDVAVHRSDTPQQALTFIRRCSRLVPKPESTFLVQVSPDLAFTRKTDIPHINFLEKRRQYYDLLAEEEGMKVIDGSQPRDMLTRLVLQEMNPICLER